MHANKYIKIKNYYENIRNDYDNFLVSCKGKSVNLKKIQNMNLTMQNLQQSIDTLNDIYESEMLIFDVTNKQIKLAENISKDLAEQQELLKKLLVNKPKGKK